MASAAVLEHAASGAPARSATPKFFLSSDHHLARYCADSNTAVHLKFHDPSAPIQATAAVVYTHHLFDEEIVFGYKDLQITLNISKSSMKMFLETNFSDDLKLDAMKVEKMADHFSSILGCQFEETSHDFERSLEEEVNFKPPGTTLHTFTIDNEQYLVNCLSREDISANLTYLNNLLALCHFYIEYASNIDLLDENWRLLIIYHKSSQSNTYNSAGFISMYKFYHHYGQIRYRISQLLILPHYQSRHLGTSILSTAYNFILSDPLTKDITVEGQSPDFEHIRNKLDLSLIVGDSAVPSTAFDGFKDYVSSKYKFCSTQIFKIYQLFKLMECDKDCAIDKTPQFKHLLEIAAVPLIKQTSRLAALQKEHPSFITDANKNLIEYTAKFQQNCEQMLIFLSNFKPIINLPN